MIETTYSYSNAVITHLQEDLEKIHNSSKNIVILKREIDLFQNDLSKTKQRVLDLRASGEYEDVLNKITSYFEIELPSCKALHNDLCKIFKLFKGTSRASSFRLSFQTIETDMCRKFHTDINDLRLLCTYYGPGTLWIPDECIDQQVLQKNNGRGDILVAEKDIQQASIGDVLIMKGALYPDANPLMHRSPPIEDQATSRLLLRIDTNEMMDF
ncbi:MAG: DUF1826 domain-containing protein [Bacteroidota bacterium]